jgi:hypothetical protein
LRAAYGLIAWLRNLWPLRLLVLQQRGVILCGVAT